MAIDSDGRHDSLQ